MVCVTVTVEVGMTVTVTSSSVTAEVEAMEDMLRELRFVSSQVNATGEAAGGWR